MIELKYSGFQLNSLKAIINLKYDKNLWKEAKINLFSKYQSIEVNILESKLIP